MPQSQHLFVSLLLLLLLARFLGELFERIKQPPMIGEVLAGIFLGPSLLGIISYSHEIKIIADLGVFLLVILAGLEINPEDIRRSMKGKNFWISVMGFGIPVLLGILTGLFWNLSLMKTIFLALCIAITALPVSVRILMDLGKLNTTVGRRIISVAIFNDIIALMILGVILDFKETQYGNALDILSSIGITVAKVLIFMGIILLAYIFIKKASARVDFLKKQIDFLVNLLKGQESLFAIMFVFILVFSSISELAGLHFIVGAFFGAMMINKDNIGNENFEKLEETTKRVAIGFLSPIFFASIGLAFSFSTITNLYMFLTIIVVSFVAKVLGGFLGSLMAGMNRNKAIAVGLGINARGIMELVIANIALNNGFVDVAFYSILVIMGMFNTFITPFALKWAFKRIDNSNQTLSQHV